MDLNVIEEMDPEVASAVVKEQQRQKNKLELIASENFASPAVREVQASVLTNKYAEGYPDKRYYGGCEYVDIAETLAISRAKKLFNADFANVQPHSGSQANMAVYFSLLKPGDTVLGMDLAHGGHLTHGSPASFSGRLYQFDHYGVRQDTGRIDYDHLAQIAKTCRPKLIVAGASAYPRIIDFNAFAQIAQSVKADLMVDMAHIAGLVATGHHPSPVPFADVVTSTTHKTLRGPRGGLILAKAEYGDRLNRMIFPGMQGGPLMHIIAAKAVALKEASQASFIDYQRKVIENAKALAAHLIEHGFRLVSGGTDNHMILVDLTNLGITGKDAEFVLGRAGMTVNKNAVPFDRQSPMITSGIRIGTAAITTRGMSLTEVKVIAGLIAAVLKNYGDEKTIDDVGKKIAMLCRSYPLFAD